MQIKWIVIASYFFIVSVVAVVIEQTWEASIVDRLVEALLENGTKPIHIQQDAAPKPLIFWEHT
jgi:hypothetical protein